eukprot:m.9547 g.9547  ORF g.9547 m.9547 type:complete len:64 (+) comp2983_c0_seq1:53-244(+)
MQTQQYCVAHHSAIIVIKLSKSKLGHRGGGADSTERSTAAQTAAVWVRRGAKSFSSLTPPSSS